METTASDAASSRSSRPTARRSSASRRSRRSTATCSRTWRASVSSASCSCGSAGMRPACSGARGCSTPRSGARPVHGRNRKGGSSSGRFARRREGQARVALQAAADVAVRVLREPAESGSLDAVVLGGDRSALTTVLSDPRLGAVRALAVDAGAGGRRSAAAGAAARRRTRSSRRSCACARLLDVRRSGAPAHVNRGIEGRRSALGSRSRAGTRIESGGTPAAADLHVAQPDR